MDTTNFFEVKMTQSSSIKLVLLQLLGKSISNIQHSLHLHTITSSLLSIMKESHRLIYASMQETYKRSRGYDTPTEYMSDLSWTKSRSTASLDKQRHCKLRNILPNPQVFLRQRFYRTVPFGTEADRLCIYTRLVSFGTDTLKLSRSQLPNRCARKQ